MVFRGFSYGFSRVSLWFLGHAWRRHSPMASQEVSQSESCWGIVGVTGWWFGTWLLWLPIISWESYYIPTDELHHFSEGWLNHQPDIHTVYTYLFHPWHLRHAGFAHGMPRHRHPIGWPHWSGCPASWKSTRGQSPATHGHNSCEDQCWAFGGERHVPAPKQDCKEQNMDHNL